MKTNNGILNNLLIFILLLTIMTVPVKAKFFPDQPFNGLQIDYSISGATLGVPIDTGGFTTSREIDGMITGDTLTISGIAKAEWGFGATLDVTLHVEGQEDVTFHEEKFPAEGLAKDPMSQEFSLSLPIPPEANNASFSIYIEGNYNAGSRGLIISGTLEKPMHTTPKPTVTRIREDSSETGPCTTFWGPFEPTGNAYAGPRIQPGVYTVFYAEVPMGPTDSKNWNWIQYKDFEFKGGKRYFILFGRYDLPQIFEETNLPSEENLVTTTPDIAILWNENDKNTRNIRYAYCLQPKILTTPIAPTNIGTPLNTPTLTIGAPIVKGIPCPNFWGPIEPTHIASAGPAQLPGTYTLFYAEIPRSSNPTGPGDWAWRQYGNVQLNGGKRYFIKFGTSDLPQIFEETNLPSEENLVTATSDISIVWNGNDNTKDLRYAYCFRSLVIPTPTIPAVNIIEMISTILLIYILITELGKVR